MNKTVVAIVGVVVAATLLFLGMSVNSEPQTPTSSEFPPPSPPPLPTSPIPGPATSSPTSTSTSTSTPSKTPPASTNVITYTDGGFSPGTLSVAKGTKVTFRNSSSRNFWPATDPHPAHTGYPEKGCKASAFDACKPVVSGESWSFTFNEAGTWEYHDHLSASRKGTVIVE